MKKWVSHDAEQYFSDKIDDIKQQIQKKKVEGMEESNSGYGFVTFKSNLQVKKCDMKKEWMRMVMEKMNKRER